MVWKFTMEIYRDEAKASEFLNREHPLLENRKPVDVEAELVINLLGRAANGGAV